MEESNRLRVEQNFSIRQAGEVIGVPFPLLSKWGKEVAWMRAAIQAQRRAHNRKAFIDGPASQLESIEDELLQFAFTKREPGINVKHTLVVCRASDEEAQLPIRPRNQRSTTLGQRGGQ